ncbi:MAG: hypothetical protein GTO45_06300 [Candidatus Aminicenantes bacterium]|nr:hypothetical protein [Candidatus Aminicenantes bacterium]NIM78435.1 hypothetical protein [Candidatus Aminicenantes bacterium]NIN17697.1 hypothetical protein [Candidatus Aminicenantes bacterium]NIN41573.1 hypothetical protein [Candidatus Aminicenantes bacterium]NIN84347.1 hypothetical protein [Candidatus Aminicenantes bacterium]
MCIVDHLKLAPGYLISADVESFAPPAILTRVLQNYDEVGLSDKQIRHLLDIAREYQEQYLKVSIEFANVTAKLDLVEPDADIKQKLVLLDRHAQLFREHESLLLRAYTQTKEILSPEQMKKAAEIYERHKQELLNGLESSLKKAVSPTLKISM